jgi:hypothetical protein
LLKHQRHPLKSLQLRNPNLSPKHLRHPLKNLQLRNPSLLPKHLRHPLKSLRLLLQKRALRKAANQSLLKTLAMQILIGMSLPQMNWKEQKTRLNSKSCIPIPCPPLPRMKSLMAQ